MPNIRLVLEYDGTDFHGWQRQPHLRTVQGIVEEALGQVSGEKFNLIGSGRTDTGVHAEGQVANFLTVARHSGATWRAAVNAHLPEDIVVVHADRVAEDFHARFDATGRTYRYSVLERETRSALYRRSAWVLQGRLDLQAMRRAAAFLRKHQDFTSFAAAGAPTENRIVDLRRIEIRRDRELLTFTFEADRFLWHMVRNLVGFLAEVGRGKVPPRETAQVLEARDRRRAGPIAPAQGLCLVAVSYPAATA